MDDEQLAADVVVAAFTRGRCESWASATDSDARLLCDVRRLAIVAAGSPGADAVGDLGNHRRARGPSSQLGDADVREAITALPEPQRAVVELMRFGRLTVAAIAAATETPWLEVASRLTDAMHQLRPVIRQRRPTGVPPPHPTIGSPASRGDARS